MAAEGKGRARRTLTRVVYAVCSWATTAAGRPPRARQIRSDPDGAYKMDVLFVVDEKELLGEDPRPRKESESMKNASWHHAAMALACGLRSTAPAGSRPRLHRTRDLRRERTRRDV
jgi:hypothetical protein